MNRLKEKYTNEIAPSLVQELGLTNVMETPKLTKITVNAGIGDFKDNKEAVSGFVEELTALTGQSPSPRKARLSEAGFKIRKGETVGYTVTLRGERMWAFLDKFANVVLPRVRDFQGLSLKSFDDHGNYSLGLKEHVIFPEVNQNTTKGIRSLQVNFSIDSRGKEDSLLLMKALGMPFDPNSAKGKKQNG